MKRELKKVSAQLIDGVSRQYGRWGDFSEVRLRVNAKHFRDIQQHMEAGGWFEILLVQTHS